MNFSGRALATLLRQIPVVWGRLADRAGWWRTESPKGNPDTTEEDLGDRYHEIRKNFAIQAAQDARDFSHLFKSAGGIDNPDSEAYVDPQLLFDRPDLGEDRQLAALAYNYDHLFSPCFNLILHKLSVTAWDYGRFIGEFDWQRLPETDQNYPNLIYAVNILDRDPAEYLINPGGFPPGLYRKNSAYATASSGDITKMDDARFLWFPWHSQFENPYGTSMNRSLVMWVETWLQVFDYWRKGIEKAGLGAWTAAYPDIWDNNSTEATSKRERLMEMVKTIAKGSASIYNEKVTLTNQKLDIEAQLFLDFHTEFKKAVSLRYLGTETALTEGQYGTYAGKESGEVRSRSDLQKYDALWFGAAMQKFNRLFCHLNFANVPVVPRLQLIPVELITPVTPKDQMIEGRPEEQETAPENPKEFQAVDEDEEIQPPVAIPAGYESFPNDTPVPDRIRDVMGFAQQALAEMPVKEYEDVTADEAPFVFTVKRFRGYASDMLPILRQMKDALAITLDAKSEKDAWEAYYELITPIFAEAGIQMTPQIRNDLNVSFRQTRQNVFAEAQMQSAMNDPAIVGMRLLLDRTAKTHHDIHTFWDGVALPKKHPELQRGGRLRPPMDFGCLCTLEPVYVAEDLTPQREWPTVYPGETYQYYAQPEAQ